MRGHRIYHIIWPSSGKWNHPVANKKCNYIHIYVYIYVSTGVDGSYGSYSRLVDYSSNQTCMAGFNGHRTFLFGWKRLGLWASIFCWLMLVDVVAIYRTQIYTYFHEVNDAKVIGYDWFLAHLSSDEPTVPNGLLDVVGFVFAKILLRKSLSPDLQAVSFPTAGDANDALQTLCVHLWPGGLNGQEGLSSGVQNLFRINIQSGKRLQLWNITMLLMAK